MIRRFRWLLLALPLAGFGCSTNRTVLDEIKAYPMDRLYDLVDVVGIDVYWGQGFLAHAQATKLAQLGAGTFDGDILKVHRRAIGVVEEMRAEAGLPLYYFSVYDREPRLGNKLFKDQHEELTGLGEVHYNLTDQNDRGFYEIGGSLALFVGLGLSIDIFQFLDFGVGFFGLDIGRDDERNQAERVRVENPRYRGTGERPVSEGLRSDPNA